MPSTALPRGPRTVCGPLQTVEPGPPRSRDRSPVGPILAQNFSADELRQLAAIFESPVKAKFDKLIPQLEVAVGDKVTVDVGPAINKNIQALTESVGTKLRIAATAQ